MASFNSLVSSLWFLPWCLLFVWHAESMKTKRTDDPNPLEAAVMQQANLIKELQAKIATLETRIAKQETAVAFNARLSAKANQNVTGTHHLVFDTVDLNQGGGYDHTTGVFTAPVSGLYEFSVKISHVPPGSFHAHIVKQGSTIAEVGANGDDRYHDRSSAAVASHVRQGQRVWVERMSSSSSVTLSSGSYQTTFMGILVTAD